MEKNEREVTYAKFQHVLTRGRKEKRSHIKFLLLLLNLTPIIKQKEENCDSGFGAISKLQGIK